MSDKIEAIERSPGLVEKASKHKWLIVGGGLAILIVLMVVLTKPDDGPGKYAKKAPPKPVTALIPGDIDQSNWISNAQVDLRKTQDQLEQLSKENRELSEQAKVLLEDNKKAREETDKTLEAMTKLKDAIEKGGIPTAQVAPDAPKPAPENTLPEGIIPPPRPGDLVDDPVTVLPIAPGSGRAGGGLQQDIPSSQPQQRAPLVIEGSPIRKISTEQRDGAGRLVDEQVKRNPFRGYLPAGSFSEIALISGADVGTAEFSRANPSPFVIRVQNNAITAGGGKYKLHSCFVLAEGFGELSSERAFIRATKLTCLDKENKLILEESIKGYIVDSDGTQGLRGEVVRRNGQLIAKALIAGFAEGIAEVGRSVSQVNSQALTSPLTGGGLQQSSVRIDPEQLGAAGAFGGASSAASQLADLYIAEAKNIFPVIRIPAGRKGTLVIQEGKSLEWKTYEGLFIVEQVPQRTTRTN